MWSWLRQGSPTLEKPEMSQQSSSTDARFHGVKFDPDGEPNWDDVQRAAQRVVMLRLQLMPVR